MKVREKFLLACLFGVLIPARVFAQDHQKQSYLAKSSGIPSPIRCDVGAVATMIGYTGSAGTNTSEGPAFEWGGEGNDYLYGGGMTPDWILGKIDGKLTSIDSTENIAPSDTFQYTSRAWDADAISDLDTYAQWRGHGLNVEVTQRTYAWSESYRDDFIVWDYSIKNVAQGPITDLYLGQRIDADISMWGGYDHWLDDLVDFYGDDPEEIIEGFSLADSIYISYMWDDDNPRIPGNDVGGRLIPKESTGYIGTITIACPPSSDGRVPANKPSAHTHMYWHEIPETPEEKYSWLSWGANHSHPYRPRPPSPYDHRYLCSWGPYNLAPGDSIRIIFATGIGEGLEGMVKNLACAKFLHQYNWLGLPPDPPDTFRAEAKTDRIELFWSSEPVTHTLDPTTGENDFEGFKLYKSEDGGSSWDFLAQFDRINEIEPNNGLRHSFSDYQVRVGYEYTYAITSYDRGNEAIGLGMLESNKARKMITIRHGTPPLPPTASMENIFVAPNPYYFHPSDFREGFPRNRLGFFNLPKKCTIRIFSLGGDLIAVLKKDDEAGDAYLDTEKLKNRVSGVYLYHVQAPQGERMGKFVVIK